MATRTIEVKKVDTTELLAGREKMPIMQQKNGKWEEKGVEDRIVLGFRQSNGFFRGIKIDPEKLTEDDIKFVVSSFNKELEYRKQRK